ncbi:MAG TPA: ADP-ribosylglycohydrolase family protein [Blastocatellia bacterium]|nr:ADP-ribosylglycohydrolase family protein [Blastocatellia bacterium]
MRTKRLMVVLMIIVLAGLAATAQRNKQPRRLSRQQLEDRIRGGWAGRMIGVSFGAPTEFKSNGRIIEGELRWTPDMVSNAIVRDDLCVGMTFTEVMDRLGLGVTTEQYGEAFRDSKYHLWQADRD